MKQQNNILVLLGLSKKGTENYMSKISAKIRITEQQKIIFLGTALILRRTLSFK